jgi:hypothetical protein
MSCKKVGRVLVQCTSVSVISFIFALNQHQGQLVKQNNKTITWNTCVSIHQIWIHLPFHSFLVYFPELGLCDLHPVCVSFTQLLNAWTIFMKLGMYIMAPEPTSTAYFINSSHQSLCLYVYPSYRCKATARLHVSLLAVIGNGSINTFLRQQIHAIEELLDTSFYMRSVSYKRRVCGSVYVYPYAT